MPGSSQGRWQLYLCGLLLVVCTIPWRQKTYFSGGLDPVVAAKAVIGLAALALSGIQTLRRPPKVAIGGRTITFATCYLTISVIGGWAAGTVLPSLVVATRVAMTLATVALLLMAFGTRAVTTALVASLGVVAMVALATGIGSVTSGRWEGGIPPLAPNEIAFICGGLVVYLVHRIMLGTGPWAPTLAIGLFGVMWLTGSRTTTATLVLAIVVMVLQARTFSIAAFLAMVLAVPAIAYVATATATISNLLLRGGTENVTTLSSRTIAWNAAASMDAGGMQRWFGGGLTLKRIPVSGQYWQDQILDSSWVSALVQAGRLGLVVVLLWVVSTAWAALSSERSWRILWTGLLAFIVPRSLLESGMFDASTVFILFALASLATEGVTRASDAQEAHRLERDSPALTEAAPTGRRV
ncbi:hypothetical protein GCM10009845_19520 [Pedococcus bigeumensis]